MSKPSIAELLNASGHFIYTPELVTRAMYALYGNIGANLDERSWSGIMQSRNPLELAETGLLSMYQDTGYLLRNTQHLETSGYVAAQAEITYRQMAVRLGFAYDAGWSNGTSYQYLGSLTMEQLIASVPVLPPPPLPTISISASADGFSIVLNVAGKVALSVSGDLGNFAAGATVLTEQTSLKEGFLTLSANGNSSAATAQYLVLGTAGNDIIDTTGAGTRVDYLFGSTGNDTLSAGAGDDVIHGGAGNDTITGGPGADSLYGGAGNDVLVFASAAELAGDTTVNGGTDTDTIRMDTGATALTLADADFAKVSDVEVLALNGTGTKTVTLGSNTNTAFATGITITTQATAASLNLQGGASYVSIYATGTNNNDILNGGAGNDTLIGGAGNDTLTGGAGADSLEGGDGDDMFRYTDNVQLREDSTISGGSGTNTIEFSAAIDTLTGSSTQGNNFHADFQQVTNVQRIALFGASSINLGEVLRASGLTTILTGNDTTTLRYDNIALGTLAIDGTALADNKTLFLTQFGGPSTGQWFNVTNLKGDVDAGGLEGAIAVTAASGSGFAVSITGGNAADTLTGGAGKDTIHGGEGNDTITGGADADTLTGGNGHDRFVFNAVVGVSSDSQVNSGVDVITDLAAGDVIVANLSNVAAFNASSINYVVTNRWAGGNLLILDTSGSDSDAAVGGIRIDIRNYVAATAASQVEYHITGTSGDDTIVTGAMNDVITGGAGADTINGGAGSDTYRYASAIESAINNVSSAAAGFDTVAITSGDIFDFSLDVAAVRSAEFYFGETPKANGDALLSQLNSYYQLAGPALGIDAMYISIGNNAKGRFLVIDVDNNDLITSNDLIIEIVGITNNKNIQLGLSGGNVVMNEVDPPFGP